MTGWRDIASAPRDALEECAAVLLELIEALPSEEYMRSRNREEGPMLKRSLSGPTPNSTEPTMKGEIPEGYVLVPLEPTEEMVAAGIRARKRDATFEENTLATWRAMCIAASTGG